MERRRPGSSYARSAVVEQTPPEAWDIVASGQSGPQWYVDAAPFVFRGALDRLVLGPGTRRRPPGRARLAAGDRVGFWDVIVADHRERHLVLRAHVRAPGQVTLRVRVEPDGERARVSLSISFAPRGLLGHAYLLADLPARTAVTELVMLHLLTILRRHDNQSFARSVDPV